MGLHIMASIASLFLLAFAGLAASATTIKNVRHTFYGCESAVIDAEIYRV
jgi:hypothetical protein